MEGKPEKLAIVGGSGLSCVVSCRAAIAFREESGW